MADTSNSQDATPQIPQPPHRLGQMTTAELSSYERLLRETEDWPLSDAAHQEVTVALADITDQWASRASITPGKAGRTWPIN